jgi:hypothetical protein
MPPRPSSEGCGLLSLSVIPHLAFFLSGGSALISARRRPGRTLYKDPMKARSAKHKGRRLQKAVRKAILAHFSDLEDEDVKVAFRSEPGCDIRLSSLAQGVFPYSVECKNVERLNVWSALSQAHTNAREGTSALLVFSRNRTEPYVALRLSDFLKLL